MSNEKMPGIFKDVMGRRGGKVNADTLWKWLQKSRKGTCKCIAKYKDEDKLDKFLERQVGDYRKYINGEASGIHKPAAQRAARKPVARNTPPYRPSTHVTQPEAFRFPNGINAAQININDYTQTSSGIIVGTFDIIFRKIMALRGNCTPQPLAFLVKGEIAALRNGDKHGHIISKYHCTEIEVALARAAGEVPITTKNIMINVGVEDIMYKPTNIVLVPLVPLFTTMSYRVVKQMVEESVFNGLKNPNAFKAHVHKTIDKEWLYPYQIPKATGMRTEEFQKGEMEIQMGCIHVLNDKVDECKRRSGRNGAFIYNWERDDTTSILPLPRKCTLKEANDTTDKLGILSRGVITTKMGFAVRIPKDETIYMKAKALIDPKLAEAVGADLMNAPDDEGAYYEVKNIVKDATYCDICDLFNPCGWYTRPSRLIKSNIPNKNAMLVFSRSLPPSSSFQYMNQWIIVTAHTATNEKDNPWSHAFRQFYSIHPPEQHLITEDEECRYNGYDEDEDLMACEAGETEAAYSQRCDDTYAQQQQVARPQQQHQHQRSWANVVKRNTSAPDLQAFSNDAAPGPVTHDIATSSDDDAPLGHGFHHRVPFPDNGHTGTVSALPDGRSSRKGPGLNAAPPLPDGQMLSQLNAVAASAQSDVLVLQQRMEATASAWRITNETAEQKMEVLVTQIGETNTQVTNLFAALETQRAATASLNDSVSDMLRRMDTIIARMDVNDAERSAKTPRTDGGSHP